MWGIFRWGFPVRILRVNIILTDPCLLAISRLSHSGLSWGYKGAPIRTTGAAPCVVFFVFAGLPAIPAAKITSLADAANSP